MKKMKIYLTLVILISHFKVEYFCRIFQVMNIYKTDRQIL